MKKYRLILTILGLLLANNLYAKSLTTERIPLISNEQVKVWKTIVYPSAQQELKMHRHDLNRIVVALTNGRLKITTNQGETHYLRLKEGQAYYLAKDLPEELHTDEN